MQKDQVFHLDMQNPRVCKYTLMHTIIEPLEKLSVVKDDHGKSLPVANLDINRQGVCRETINCFIKRQINELSRGGVSTLLRKSAYLLLMPLIMAAVSLIRLIRPLVIIRFRCLESSRIGQFAADTQIYLCEKDAGMHSRKTLDLFYHCSPVSNYQLKKMFDRRLKCSSFFRILDQVNRALPGWKRHVVPWPTERDIHNLITATPQHLFFTEEEESFGNHQRGNMGIPDGSDFICFHARDCAYLDTAISSENWRRHDFRDSRIQTYLPAAFELASRGYFMVRMGAIVKEPLNSLNPMVIDYAVKFRNDFLDIYLPAKCRFFICSLTGIAEIAKIFRRPVVWVNCIPVGHIHSWDPLDLSIPKKLWLRKEKRFLTFREILESGAERFLSTSQYEELDIEVVDNTAEEITALAVEMDERLKGIWQTTEEDEELQKRFWSFFQASDLHEKINARIGRDFLRQNKNLLY